MEGESDRSVPDFREKIFQAFHGMQIAMEQPSQPYNKKDEMDHRRRYWATSSRWEVRVQMGINIEIDEGRKERAYGEEPIQLVCEKV